MKTYGICKLTLIPVRKEPSDRSEMVTQLLFGETFDFLEERDGWSYIRMHFDQYQGWITTKMATAIDLETLTECLKLQSIVLKEPIAMRKPNQTSPHTMPMAGGSLLTKEIVNDVFYGTSFPDEYKPLSHELISKNDIPSTAKKYLNAPYLWGGRTIFGIDCSGFTQVVFKMNGISLPRDAYQQAELGETIDSPTNSQPADLAFFQRADGYIVHTGIVLDNSEIIHASGKVRIDQLDVEGIYNRDENKYTHKLKFIKRII